MLCLVCLIDNLLWDGGGDSEEMCDLSAPCPHLCCCLLQTPPACSVGAVGVSRAGAPRCSTQLPLAVILCFPKHFA